MIIMLINNKNLRSIATKLIIVSCLSLAILSVKPSPAKAIFGVGDYTFTQLLADWSPTGIANNIGIWFNYLKEFGLDKLAYLAAKQILHKMTADVVQWANSGFDGNPAFLTNPEAFFLDAADQATGEFISSNGPLKELCSPWSVDIRLSIALEQAQTSFNGVNARKRYRCTLGTIIENAKNTDINIDANIQQTNADIESFLAGNFTAGGWDGFVSLVAEEANNPFSTYLNAYADQQQVVAKKQGAISADLSMGFGFMTWEECKDIPGAVAGASLDDDVNEFSPGRKIGKNGNVQECTKETPGSVISNTLQKHLNVPATELELADNINSVINAVMTQMINQMLTKGLYALSSSGSGTTGGGGRSYLSQVIDDASKPPMNDASTIIQNAQIFANIISVYGQATNLVSDSKNLFLNARACFVSKLGPNSPQIANIDLAIDAQVDPLLKNLDNARISVNTDYNQKTSGNSGSSEDVSAFLSAAQATANTNLGIAQSESAKFTLAANTFQQQCDAIK